jgi:CMP-N-acetylneuraminic acid synthetase
MSDRTLAVIPARGGSKRVSQKNIREVGGKPLIAHTIQDAEEADFVDKAIVSTDDDDIARVSRDYGAEVPFLRPSELATDTAGLAGVITHALDWADNQGNQYDFICALQATSPLRIPDDIDGLLTRLKESNADSCVTISEYITPPQWAVTPDEEGYLSEYFEHDSLWGDDPDRSQDTPEISHPNGAIFAATREAWRNHKSFYTPNTVGYRMPPSRSFDIDEPWELELIRSVIDNPTYIKSTNE